MKKFFICMVILSSLALITAAQENQTNLQQAEVHYERGNQLFDEGLYADALAVYQEGLTLVQDVDEPDLERALFRSVGKTYRELAEYDAAYNAFNNALQIAQNLEDWSTTGILFNELGILFADWGDTDKAFDYYQQSLEVYETQVYDPYNEGVTLANVAWLHKQLGNNEQELEYYLMSLPVSQRAGNYQEQATTHHNLGDLYRELEQYDIALDHYSKALTIRRKTGNHGSEGADLNETGLICDLLNQDDIALAYYLAALEQHRLANAPSEEVTTLWNIASVFREKEQYADEINFLEQQLKIYQDNEMLRDQIITLDHISYAYLQQEQYEQALGYLQQALEITQVIGNKSYEATVQSNIGRLYYRQGMYENALEFYFSALPTHKELGPPFQEGRDLLRIAKAYELLGQPDVAVDYFKMALSVTQEVGNRALIQLSLLGLVDNYEMLGQADLAQDYRSQIQVPEDTNEATAPEPLCQPFVDEMPKENPTHAVVFTISNESDTSICYVYLAEVDSYELGKDQLGIRESIPTYREHQLTVESGTYDLTLVDCSGNDMDFYRAFDITQATTMTYRFESDRVRPLVDEAGENLNSNPHLALANYRTVLAIVQQTYRIGDVGGFEGLLHGQLSWMYIGTGDFDISEKHALLALERLNTVENPDSNETFAISGSYAALGMIYTLRGQFDDAMQSFDNALEHADPVTRMYLTSIKALVLQLTGENNRAISLLEALPQASDDASTDFTDDVLPSTLCNLMRVQGNYDQKMCVEVLEADPFIQAFNKVVRGGMQLESGQYADALESFDQSIAIYESLDNQVVLAEALNGKAVAYFRLGQYQDALTTLDEALAIAEEYNLLISKEQILANQAVVLESTGNVGQALQKYNLALEYNKSLCTSPDESSILTYTDSNSSEPISDYCIPSDAVAILTNIAKLNQALGNYESAMEDYTEALKIAVEIEEPPRQTIILNNQGLLFAFRGLNETNPLFYSCALKNHKIALALQTQQSDRDGQGYTLNHIGDLVRVNKGLPSTSDCPDFMIPNCSEFLSDAECTDVFSEDGVDYSPLDFYEQALAIHDEVGNQVAYAATLNSIGRVSAESDGDYAAAIKWMTQAVEVAEQINHPHLLNVVLTDRGIVYEQLGETDLAVQDYRQAIDLETTILQNAGLDHVILGIQNQRHREEIYPWNQSASERLSIIFARRGELNTALSIYEQNQAVLIRTELINGSIDYREGLDTEQLHTEVNLRFQLKAAQEHLNSLIGNNDSTGFDIQEAKNKVTELQQTYTELLQKLQLEGGFLERQIAISVKPLDEIQSTIPDETAMIVFSLGHSESLAFVITPDDVNVVILDTTIDAINSAIKTYNGNRQTKSEMLNQLYDELIAPIHHLLDVSHLVIVPSGNLSHISFAALQNAENNVYLVDEFSISYVSSATSYVLLSEREKQSQQISQPTESLILAQPQASNPDLDLLHNAVSEAQEVAEILNSIVFTDATEGDFRNHVAGKEVIYISAHAALNTTSPQFSTIYLGNTDSYDGNINVFEIFELDLSLTDLVVLSGCETGATDHNISDGFGLLNRAFIIAGASDVVASLWTVQEDSTTKLLTIFIQNRTTMSEAEALRQAMLLIKDEYPDPYNWAGFVLNGANV